MSTLLERIQKWHGRYYGDGVHEPATKEELERVAAIAQSVEDCAGVAMTYDEILRRADELLEGR